MENACVGCVVRSKCGRDRKRIFLIVGVCPDGSGRVLVADGVLHRRSAPKKKNLSHLAVLAAADEERTSVSRGTDEEIQRYLAGFERDLLKS